MDREQTMALVTEAKRLRATLIEASSNLANFTQRLRDLLDLNEDLDRNRNDLPIHNQEDQR